MMTSNHNVEQLINNLLQNDDFFTPSIIVFDNLKMEQWFKAYWLKTRDDIYMNIKCLRFNDLYYLIFKEHNKRILDQNVLSKYIMLVLSKWPFCDDIKYIYDGTVIDPSRLYEYAQQLADLFKKYDADLFTPTGFQKALYDAVVKKASEDGYDTLRHMFENESMSAIPQHTYIYVTRDLKALEQAIIQKYQEMDQNNLSVFKLEPENQNKKIDQLMIAPSELREVEALHSQICRLVSTGVSPSDISVYAPNIDSYAFLIERIFKETNFDYPNIPYSLSKKEEDDVWSALKTIKRIFSHRYCTRTDFIDLLRNEQVRKSSNIDNELLNIMIDSILDSNTYRKHQYGNDWLDLKRRMLLSKIVGEEAKAFNITKVGSHDYLPYQSISLNDDAIIKLIYFIDIIMSIFNYRIDYPVSDVRFDFLHDMIKKLLFNKEDYRYFKIVKELDLLKDFDQKYHFSLNFETVLTDLISLFENSMISTPFNGVTFLNISDRTIIHTSYVFVMGMSSHNYPAKTTNAIIDQHPNLDELAKQTKLFNNIISGAKYLCISYVERNLKNDEEYYPSPIIEKMLTESENVLKVDIDETRKVEDLYTKWALNNFYYYKSLLELKQFSPKQINGKIESEEIKAVAIKKLADYLEEPLSCKTKFVISAKDDDITETKDQFELLEIAPIKRSKIVEEIMALVFNNQDTSEDELIHMLKKDLPAYPFEITEFQSLVTLSSLLVNNFKEEHPNAKLEKIPDLVLKYSPLQLINEEKIIVTEKIAKLEESEDPDEEAIQNYQNYLQYLNDKSNVSNDEVTWTIKDCGSIAVERKPNEYSYLDFKFYNTYKKVGEMYLKMYVYSLIDAARLDNDDEIKMHITLAVEKKAECLDYKDKDYLITRKEALHILNKIHYYMTDFTENAFISAFSKGPFLMADDLLMEAQDKWKYFNSKDTFDATKICTIIMNNQVISPSDDDFIKCYNNLLVKHRLLVDKIIEGGKGKKKNGKV